MLTNELKSFKHQIKKLQESLRVWLLILVIKFENPTHFSPILQFTSVLMTTTRLSISAITVQGLTAGKDVGVKVDRETCHCAFLLRINVIEIVSLLLSVHSSAFRFMC